MIHNFLPKHSTHTLPLAPPYRTVVLLRIRHGYLGHTQNNHQRCTPQSPAVYNRRCSNTRSTPSDHYCLHREDGPADIRRSCRVTHRARKIDALTLFISAVAIVPTIHTLVTVVAYVAKRCITRTSIMVAWITGKARACNTLIHTWPCTLAIIDASSTQRCAILHFAIGLSIGTACIGIDIADFARSTDAFRLLGVAAVFSSQAFKTRFAIVAHDTKRLCLWTTGLLPASQSRHVPSTHSPALGSTQLSSVKQATHRFPSTCASHRGRSPSQPKWVNGSQDWQSRPHNWGHRLRNPCRHDTPHSLGVSFSTRQNGSRSPHPE